jgi:hypothetical protein
MYTLNRVGLPGGGNRDVLGMLAHADWWKQGGLYVTRSQHFVPFIWPAACIKQHRQQASGCAVCQCLYCMLSWTRRWVPTPWMTTSQRWTCCTSIAAGFVVRLGGSAGGAAPLHWVHVVAECRCQSCTGCMLSDSSHAWCPSSW